MEVDYPFQSKDRTVDTSVSMAKGDDGSCYGVRLRPDRECDVGDEFEGTDPVVSREVVDALNEEPTDEERLAAARLVEERRLACMLAHPSNWRGTRGGRHLREVTDEPPDDG